MRYTHNKYSVFAGKVEIGRLYVDSPFDELRILQGMDRVKTVEKIIEDCPEFAKDNNIDGTKRPLLFSN
jgi:hypothetical protein